MTRRSASRSLAPACVFTCGSAVRIAERISKAARMASIAVHPASGVPRRVGRRFRRLMPPWMPSTPWLPRGAPGGAKASSGRTGRSGTPQGRAANPVAFFCPATESRLVASRRGGLVPNRRRTPGGSVQQRACRFRSVGNGAASNSAECGRSGAGGRARTRTSRLLGTARRVGRAAHSLDPPRHRVIAQGKPCGR